MSEAECGKCQMSVTTGGKSSCLMEALRSDRMHDVVVGLHFCVESLPEMWHLGQLL